MRIKKNKITRKKTCQIQIGDVKIGGKAPISVQSMTCTKTEDVRSTIDQIHRLEEAGCEIVRVAVPTMEAADAILKIKKAIRIPLVADIHFDHRLALKAIAMGADKIRINPGNIGSKERVIQILESARERRVPIRIGVNAGSLEKAMIEKYRGISAKALLESALKQVHLCEKVGFNDLVISIKASNVCLMIEANRLLSKKIEYPIHLGVTEAGTPRLGMLRSAVGIGTLIAEGIGDTIRVSLTGDPVEEVKAGYEILKSLCLREHGLTVISCPTCGRTQTNVVSIVEKVEKALSGSNKSLTLAIMGCAVNGPGEAKEADIGIACGRESALFFKKGEVIGKIREADIVDVLVKEVREWKE